MELALYCPNSGYYEREDVSPGRAGDFYTSVSVGPLFGRLLADRFAGWLDRIPANQLQLVEGGGHDGQLALDILSWLEEKQAPCWPRLEYWLIEPSLRRRAWQARRLERFADRIRWLDAPESLGSDVVNGVIFSNELLDAFPVTRLRWDARAGGWNELGVDVGPAGFEWAVLPAAPAQVEKLLLEAGLAVPPALASVLPDGFTIDLAPQAGYWWRSAAAALREGVLLTFDYGLEAEELLSPVRANGTLRAYRDHRVTADVLAAPGLQDLTHQVNFTQLRRAGELVGLRSEPLRTQARFLTAIAEHYWAGKGGALLNPAEVRQFQTLTHPEHLGRRFQVLMQRRTARAAPATATASA